MGMAQVYELSLGDVWICMDHGMDRDHLPKAVRLKVWLLLLWVPLIFHHLSSATLVGTRCTCPTGTPFQRLYTFDFFHEQVEAECQGPTRKSHQHGPNKPRVFFTNSQVFRRDGLQHATIPNIIDQPSTTCSHGANTGNF